MRAIGLLITLLLGVTRLAEAAPTPLVSCQSYGTPLIEAAHPGVASILLDPDGDARIQRSSEPVGTQPLALVASGTGLLVDRNGQKATIAWVCLLESEDRALFFHWVRTSPASPAEPCRTEAAPTDRAACLQTRLDAAERDLAAINARLAPRPVPQPDTGLPRPAPPPRLPSDTAWRSYRDAECARRQEAAGTGATDALLTCMIERTLARMAELNEF